MPVVWALTLVLGVLNAFENPARRGLVTELVEPQDITNATSLNTAVMTGSRIFGPALAAVLVDTVGTAWCFLLNAVSYVAVLVSLFLLRPAELYAPPLAARGGRPGPGGAALHPRDRELLVTFVVMAIVSTFAFNYGVSLPKLADERWGGEGNFGLVLSVTSIGSLIGSLLTARLAWVSMRWYLGNIVLLGVAGLGMAWAPNLAAALAWASRSASAGRRSSAAPTASPSRRARRTCAAGCWRSPPSPSSARRRSAARSPGWSATASAPSGRWPTAASAALLTRPGVGRPHRSLGAASPHQPAAVSTR